MPQYPGLGWPGTTQAAPPQLPFITPLPPKDTKQGYPTIKPGDLGAYDYKWPGYGEEGGGWPGPGGSGGPGRGPVELDALPPWAGALGDQSWLGMSGMMPWSDWGQSPWANVPEGREEEAMAWMNVSLPWYQQALGERQFWRQVELQQQLQSLQTFGHRQLPSARWL